MKVAIFVNYGGMGDVVMALNCIKQFKQQNPEKHITFLCAEDVLPLTYNNPYIDKILPFRLYDKSKFDKVYNLSDEICLKYEMKVAPKVKKTRMEIFAKALNIKQQIIPNLYISEAEKEALPHVLDLYRIEKNKFKIGIISRAGSYSRIYPYYEQLENLKPDNSQIIIFKGRSIDWSDTQWENAIIVEGRPIREAMLVLSACDIVVGNDTGPMHIAASLGISTLWLFSHIDAKMRVKEYKNANYIQGECSYSPCWYDMQCVDKGIDNRVYCIKSIKPEEIMKKILEIKGVK